MSARVLASFNCAQGDRCVDIFVREDGTFGFEEYRRDSEDMKGWFPLHRYSSLVFASEKDALARARATVSWLVGVSQ